MFRNYYYNYFLINLSDYENIGIDFEINKALFILTVVLGIALILFDMQRGAMSQIAKQLIRHRAIDESSSSTLKELGLDSSPLVKLVLSRRTEISRVVRRVGAVSYSYEEYVELIRNNKKTEEKIDFSKARFYIPESESERAKHIYDSYGSSFIKTALLCLLLLTVFVCLSLLMPGILTFLNNSVNI